MFTKNTLQGKALYLDPLGLEHADALADVVKDGELWRLFFTMVPSPEEVPQFIQNAILEYEAGQGLSFAIIDKKTDKLVGSSRFLRADCQHKRAEIGFSFLAQSAQKTMLNTEAKYLMLCHAFEHLSLLRVELLTDFLNLNSRAAIARLGARQEGIMRNHLLMPDGRSRDSVLFSITTSDWPGVKQHLQLKLAGRGIHYA